MAKQRRNICGLVREDQEIIKTWHCHHRQGDKCHMKNKVTTANRSHAPWKLGADSVGSLIRECESRHKARETTIGETHSPYGRKATDGMETFFLVVHSF